MVQVLPYNPRPIDRIFDSLNQQIENVGQAYGERQVARREKKAISDWQTKLTGLTANGRQPSPTEIMSIIGDAPASIRPHIGSTIAAYTKEVQKGQNEQAFLDQVARAGNPSQQPPPSAQQNMPPGAANIGGQQPAEQPTPSNMPNIAQPARKPYQPRYNEAQRALLLQNPKTRAAAESDIAEQQHYENLAQKEAEAAQKQSDAEEKARQDRIDKGLADTKDIRTSIQKEGAAAADAVESKKRLSKLAKSDKIDHPLVVAAAKWLPKDISDSILSPETHVYRSGLIDEIVNTVKQFPGGQVRVIEIELAAEKVAGLSLTDQQKIAVLEAPIPTLEMKKKKAEIARQIEDEQPELRALAFSDELNKRMQPYYDKAIDEIASNFNKIFREAAKNPANKGRTISIEKDGDIKDVPVEDADYLDAALKAGYKYR